MSRSSPEDERLKALEARLAQAKEKPEEEPSGAAIALRMGTEMVAGVAVGAGFGFFVDRFFGTLPLFLVIFLFIGAAAGVKMMMQTSNRYSQTDDENNTENKE